MKSAFTALLFCSITLAEDRVVPLAEDQSLAFMLEYPSPPPADSGAQFQKAIAELSKRLKDDGIRYNTQGFLGNHYTVQNKPTEAKRVLLDHSKNSPFKLTIFDMNLEGVEYRAHWLAAKGSFKVREVGFGTGCTVLTEPRIQKAPIRENSDG